MARMAENSLCLQHLPDFKGIETYFAKNVSTLLPCSTSLTSKGLRRTGSSPNSGKTTCSTSLTSKGLRPNKATGDVWVTLQHLPDFKGIETQHQQTPEQTYFLQHLPDFKGIETTKRLITGRLSSCSTSLTSKGLRQIVILGYSS